MKKLSFSWFCLIAIALLAWAPYAGVARAEQESTLHEYFGIPFDTATPDEAAQILLNQTGATLTNEGKTGFQYYANGISTYDHVFSALVEFNADLVGINRIHLSKSDRSIWSSDAEEFSKMVWEDIGIYLDMEKQLIGQYGNPDWRFFTTDGKNYHANASARFMFQSNQWDAKRMMDICKNDHSFYAHTAWGNVVLDLWVIWRDEGTKKSKSDLSLYYYPEIAEIDTDSILVFPCAVDD